MSIDPRIQGAGDSQTAASSGARQPASQAGAAFRAVLERLEERSRALGAASDSLDDPRRLGEAVESARASIEEAAALSGDLLEAYRAARQRDETTNTTPTDSGPGGDAPRGQHP